MYYTNGTYREDMPGIKELEHFREELTRLGNEREVTEERGETYEPLPPPSITANSAPSIDVDNLLAGIGESTEPVVAPETVDDASILSDSTPLPESGGGMVPEAPDADSGPALSDFDSLLDSLDLDGDDSSSGQGDTSAEIPGPDDFSLPDFPEPVTDSLEPGDTPAELTEKPVEPLESFDSFSDDAAGLSGSFDASAGEAAESLDTPAELTEEAAEPLETLDELTDEAGEPLESLETPSGDAPVDPVAALDALLAAGLPELDDDDTTAFSMPDDLPSFDEISPPDVAGETEPEAPESAELPDEGFSLPDDFSLPSFGDEPADISDGETEVLPPEDTDHAAALADLAGFDTLDDLGGGDSTAEPEEIPASSDFETMDLTPPSAEFPVSGSVGEPDTIQIAPPSGDFSDFSIPDDLPIPPEEEASSGEEAAIDGFDGFSLDEDILQGASGTPEDEFHIPGFSDFAEGTGLDGLDELIPKDTSRKSSRKEIPLEISEKEFDRFLDLLAKYPLNLRMAIEEYLSEGPGSELQKMEIVHHVLEGTPLKKVARMMEDRLNRAIPIPKDFEKKTAAEYEQEKSSLRYIFLNRILPAAILFTGISILTFCVIFLSWQFVYRPLAAEHLYKRGYAAIEDARYTQSMKLFDEAVVVWDKKKWYFRYARAYRDKKQYISAETMYERLLNRFRNDREAGLEYAEMLRTDLRNFEKAETVLKRRVLDNYVNDSDGMMLLGDTYLDWGEEDPTKYEEARKMYASLIELYGEKDPYLARMMRYFIRTDNLAEVLPLKDHFVSKRKMTLGTSDLVELGGYLLDKRYNPLPGDSEKLRSRIEDVRDILENAVEFGPEIPEAHYNMGRFFIHNYKPEQASAALGESLKLFDNATPMSPKRVLTRVDAFRLLGELRTADKEYLRAQALYAQGMALYEQQRENRAVPRDPRVGRLYADSADIDYFISNDLDTALVHYRKALEELHDTPSVRYRTGYIYYQKRNFEEAMHAFSRTYAEKNEDRHVRYAFANTLFRRGNHFAAQGHYERLMESLEAERIRKGIVLPQVRTDHGDFVEQYMKTANNLGVTLNRLANRTGDSGKNARALSLLAESARAWDALTRNPETLVRLSRMRPANDPADTFGTTVSDVNGNLAYMNIKYMTYPRPEFQPELYSDIPKTLESEAPLQQREDR